MTDPGYAPSKLLSRDLRDVRVVGSKWSLDSSSKHLSNVSSADNLLDTSENSSVI